MKIFFGVLFFLASIKLTAQDTAKHSPADSVTCIPNSQLRQAARINEQHKILLKADSLKDIKITLLQGQINNRDSAMFLHLKIDSNNNELLAYRTRQLDLSNQKYKVEVDFAAEVQKAYNKQRLLKFTVGGIGIGVSGFLLYELIRK